jgi:hypothetical protein
MSALFRYHLKSQMEKNTQKRDKKNDEKLILKQNLSVQGYKAELEKGHLNLLNFTPSE